MTTPTYADLKIDLEREASGGHRIRLSFRLDTSAADEDFRARSQSPVVFDLEALRTASLNPQQYGQLLTSALFADPQVRRRFADARAQARTPRIPLRLRLALDPEDAALHGLRWEWLQDPDSGEFLALSERVLLSRYLLGGTGEPISLPVGQQLRALVVIANPTDREKFGLAAIDVVAERRRILTALGPIAPTLLASGSDHPPTVANLLAALRAGPELLIVVAHGSLVDSTPYLWLERADGQADRVDGGALRERLEGAEQRPQLAILAACEGAGRDDGTEPLAALGPLLVAAGMPAVVAMQGRVSIAAVGQLLPTLLSELRRTGQVDQAMAAARLAAEREHADWWRPTLTMRVRDGRLWQAAAPEPREGVNPFTAGSKIGPDRFFGRQEQIAIIRDCIGGDTPECVSIVGFRRSGRSSLLHYIHDRIHVFCPAEKKPIVVALSLSAERFQTPEGITEGLRRGIADSIDRSPWNREENSEVWVVDNALERLKSSGHRLIVLIDEFDQIKSKLKIFENWIGDWRRRVEVQGYMTLIIATTRPIYELYDDYEPLSLFSSMFPTIVWLGALEKQEWQTLVRNNFGRSVNDSDLALLDEIAGGMPFYTQLAAQLLWRYHDHTRTRAEFAVLTKQYFDMLWRNLSDAERNILRRTASSPDRVSLGDQRKKALWRYGLLRNDGSLFSSTLADYLQEYY